MPLGISDDILARLEAVFARYEQVRRVVVFGSRARGDYKYNSDIDIAIFADNDLSASIYADIDEAVGIYKVDIVEMAIVQNEKLIKKINSEGVEIYFARGAVTASPTAP